MLHLLYVAELASRLTLNFDVRYSTHSAAICPVHGTSRREMIRFRGTARFCQVACGKRQEQRPHDAGTFLEVFHLRAERTNDEGERLE